VELFEGSFEVVDGFLSENVKVGEIVGVVDAFISGPKDVEPGLVVGEESACPQFSLSPILPGFTGHGS
jgi:hypothetical protein